MRKHHSNASFSLLAMNKNCGLWVPLLILASTSVRAGFESWTPVGSGLTEIRTLALGGGDGLYAGTPNGVYRKISEGNWVASNRGLSNLSVRALLIDSVSPSTIYAGTDAGTFTSVDAGANWQASAPGMENLRVNALAMDANATLFAATAANGVYRRTATSWVAKNEGLGQFLNISSLVIDKDNTMSAGTGGGIYNKVSSGTAWQAITDGLSYLTVLSLAVDPNVAQQLYAGTAGGGVYRWDILNNIWLPAESGLTATDLSPVVSLAVNPLLPQNIYAGTTNGVFKSIDRGVHWQAINQGLPQGTVWALAFDAATPGLIYAGTTSGGVFAYRENQPPIANAGPDQSGFINFPVTLDGSASSDPDTGPNATLAYQWKQVFSSGSSLKVTLSNPSIAKPVFTPKTLGTYRFQLVVDDGALKSSPNTAVVTVKKNRQPAAKVSIAVGGLPPQPLQGSLKTIKDRASIQLDGTESSDSDAGPLPLTFAWTQTGGPDLAISATDLSRSSFKIVPTVEASYRFQLVVSDGDLASKPKKFTIRFHPTKPNKTPLAKAGNDQTVRVAELVTLDGSQSRDPDNWPPSGLKFHWGQSHGATASLVDASAPKTTFSPTQPGIYTFRLEVSDGISTGKDSVRVKVNPLKLKAQSNSSQTPDHQVTFQAGTAGTSPNLGPVSHSWTRLAEPLGGNAPMSATGTSFSFKAHRPGVYRYKVVASQDRYTSPPVIAAVRVWNAKPKAQVVNSNVTTSVGQPIQLDGTTSVDPDDWPSALSYHWKGQSIKGISNAETAAPQFTPAKPGLYVFGLTVDDGASRSTPVKVMVKVQQP